MDSAQMDVFEVLKVRWHVLGQCEDTLTDVHIAGSQGARD